MLSLVATQSAHNIRLSGRPEAEFEAKVWATDQLQMACA